MINIPQMTFTQKAIFDELAFGKPLTRSNLVEILKTPRTTIYDNLVQLQKEKLVMKFSRNTGIRGRPYIFWYIPKNILKQIQERKNAV